VTVASIVSRRRVLTELRIYPNLLKRHRRLNGQPAAGADVFTLGTWHRVHRLSAVMGAAGASLSVGGRGWGELGTGRVFRGLGAEPDRGAQRPRVRALCSSCVGGEREESSLTGRTGVSSSRVPGFG